MGQERPSVLITGASSGIGAAAARLLCDRGFRVFGTSRHPDDLPDDAPDVEWIPLDVCNDDSVEKGVARVLAATERLDALVANAGYGIFGSVEEVPLAEARAQFETNVFGVLRSVRAVVPAMREAGRGRIAIVGSLAGRAPIPFQAHYSATKAAVDSLAQALRIELAPHGVGVSLIEPGDIRTEFNDRTSFADVSQSVYGERIRRCERVVLEELPKAPPPEIVAHAILEALTARHPRIRYPVGPDSRMVPFGRRFLPEGLFHRTIRSHFGV